MANTVQSRDSGTIRPAVRGYELKVSPYERVASMLLALLGLLGLTVLIMFVLWLTSRFFAARVAVPVVLEEIGTGEGGLTGGMDLGTPMAEELGAETDLPEPSLEKTLAVVADAVATQQAVLDDPTLSDQAVPGRGGSTGDGRGFGKGSGPGGSGRRRHWEVSFLEGNSLDTYARQLDFFEIELGVLIPEENRVIYASNLAKPVPDTRTGPADQEKRYYLTWRRGGLEEADRELLSRAGISAQGRLILKFITKELEAQLADMEKKRAGAEANEVRATYFGILPDRGGYRFYIVDQTYR